jgi:hypothetical protein
MAGVAFGPVARPWVGDWLKQLPSAHADHVRELCGRAAERTDASRQGDRGIDCGGQPCAAAGTTVDLPGRVWLPGVCEVGGAARVGPIYARRGRSPDRRRFRVYRVAVSELALRPAVHARHLPARAAWAGGGIVGAEGDGCAREPRGGGIDCARRAQDGSLGEVGGGVRGFEPGAAGAGGGGRS